MYVLYSSGQCYNYYTFFVSLLLSPQFGYTPLFIASSNGHTDVVKLLLENKADPNIRYMVSYSIISIH